MSSDSEGDWTDDDEFTGDPVTCLFSDTVCESLPELKAHMLATYGFDLSACLRTHKLDFYGQVKLVNYIRGQVADGKESVAAIVSQVSGADPATAALWASEKYLIPVLADDAVLFGIHDLDEEEGAEAQQQGDDFDRMVAARGEQKGGSASGEAAPTDRSILEGLDGDLMQGVVEYIRAYKAKRAAGGDEDAQADAKTEGKAAADSKADTLNEQGMRICVCVCVCVHACVLILHMSTST
jgi:hypothetical protein